MQEDENEIPVNAGEATQEFDAADENQVEIDPVEMLATENADLKDRVLRMAADMENLRKRTEREVNDGRTYAIANFARDMLTATDNLSRALMVLTPEARENADAAMKSLIDGIEMTDREMQRLMQKNGVKPILAEGEKFDPHQHQAMFEIPNTEVPEGTVVQVMQPGFVLGGRVLRPAMVGVSKGGPKAAPKSSTDNATDASAQGDVEGDPHFDKKA